MESESELKTAFRTTAIISGALVASLLLYTLIVELIMAQMKPFQGFLVSGLGPQTLRYIFYGAAVGAVILVRFASRNMLKMSTGEDLHHLISRLSRTSVITSSLGELPAVLGFVLFLLTGFSRDFYILLFVSILLEFMYFPRLRVWQDLARERFPQQGA